MACSRKRPCLLDTIIIFLKNYSTLRQSSQLKLIAFAMIVVLSTSENTTSKIYFSEKSKIYTKRISENYQNWIIFSKHTHTQIEMMTQYKNTEKTQCTIIQNVYLYLFVYIQCIWSMFDRVSVSMCRMWFWKKWK